MNRTLHFEVLTGSFAIDVHSPSVASVDNRACVLGDVFPPEGLRGQRRGRSGQWRLYVHRGLANASSRRIFLGPSGWSCKINYFYYYYNFHPICIYWIILYLLYYIKLNYIIFYFIYYIISYHILSNHITSHHIPSYHITSYHIISYHILLYYIILYYIISYYIMYPMGVSGEATISLFNKRVWLWEQYEATFCK